MTMYDELTYRHPRTLAECAWPCNADEAVAIQRYRAPLTRRLVWSFFRTGWLLIVLALAALVLTGCADDVQLNDAIQQDLSDAQRQARTEHRLLLAEVAMQKK